MYMKLKFVHKLNCEHFNILDFISVLLDKITDHLK